jgi:hypothetical protein
MNSKLLIALRTSSAMLALATSAFAEGAWTLWMMGASSPWDSIDTFSTRELCMEALATSKLRPSRSWRSRSPKTRPLGRSSQRVLTRTFAGSACPTPTTRAGRRGSDARAPARGGRAVPRAGGPVKAAFP